MNGFPESQTAEKFGTNEYQVLIVADIIRTVIVNQTAESVAVLATIVLVRIVLSWSLAVEIDGVWPWKKGSAVRVPTENESDG